MARDMFTDVVEASVAGGAHQRYTVPLSILTHFVLVAILVIAPLTSTTLLPTPQSVLAFATPPPPPVPPAPPEPRLAPPPPPADAAPADPDVAPLEAPMGIADEQPPLIAIISPPRLPNVDLPVAGFESGRAIALTTPPAPPPVRVGGAVSEPQRVHHVAPIYPAIARRARMEGIVILEVVIGTDGRVRDTAVLRSGGMFDQAALDAVRQWRYTIPTLNGLPVDVAMTVTVRFTLN